MGEALPIIFHLFRKIKVALAEVGKAPDSLDLFARWGIPEIRKHSPLWMCVYVCVCVSSSDKTQILYVHKILVFSMLTTLLSLSCCFHVVGGNREFGLISDFCLIYLF